MKNSKALLIIDMQKGSFTDETPRYDTDGVIRRINELAETFRNKNWPVIFIQHDGTKTGEFIPGTTQWQLLEELHVKAGDTVIDKIANDAFYKTALQSKLVELQVKELFISGCATDFCVAATIQSALAKDYNITVVSDGHTTGDRPHLKAEKVIEHYNWVWENMIPTNGRIDVGDFGSIKSSVT